MKKFLTAAGLIAGLLLPIGLIIGVMMAMPSYSENMLKKLGPPAGLIRIMDAGSEEMDGTAPERAWITYEVAAADKNSIHSYYKDSCQKLGLRTVPDADEKIHYPNAVCFGEYSNVEVVVEQKQGSTFVHMEVSRF